jgi:NitT/TauT family transport system permease protein
MFSSQPISQTKKGITWGDLAALAIVGFLLYGMIATAERWTGDLQPNFTIDLSDESLPMYALYSLFRALIAYSISLTFTLVFGYWAAKQKTAEQIIIPLMDIGQSIPVLGFLPGLVLGLISIFPHSNFGLELACILMIFTGQVWNMAFSYYYSLKSIPNYFFELSSNVRLSTFQRMVQIELPYSASGLAWNSLMSMAGGWFYLTVCEAFVLGDRQFRLPGLGSFMAMAIEQGNTHAIFSGLLAMVSVIVGMDFLLWRPIVSWTRRFRLDEQQDAVQEIPFIQLLLRESSVARFMGDFVKKWFREEHAIQQIPITPNPKILKRVKSVQRRFRFPGFIGKPLKKFKMGNKAVFVAFVVVGFWLSGKLFRLLEPLAWSDYLHIFQSAAYTFGRVLFAVLVSTLWAVPFGLWVGLSPRLTLFFQPVIQVAASFPAPMLYPIVLTALSLLGIQLGIGAGVLMLLGVQWYVLFNVLAGAAVISRELRDTFKLTGISSKETWLNLYLPSIFPSLVTGWVTAAGGAWNASIVSEYIQFKGETLKTVGLGALISEATASANYSLLAGSLIMMVIIVVSLNRLVWHPLYSYVERRFRFER